MKSALNGTNGENLDLYVTQSLPNIVGVINLLRNARVRRFSTCVHLSLMPPGMGMEETKNEKNNNLGLVVQTRN